MQETRRAVLDTIADGPVSGPDLATRLGVSRAAVWKHVEALREGGFGVESTDEGYVLDSVPEYGGLAVEYGLDAPFEIEFHHTIPSTNARARELVSAGDGAGVSDGGGFGEDDANAKRDVVVLADGQTGGRGRLDREWASPSGGIWLSVLCQPDLPPAHAPIYTLAAAVAVTRAVRAEGVDAGIKWPNDVLVRNDDLNGDSGERKLAGILTEMQGEADRISWMIVGIGLNANIDAGDVPRGATSLREEIGDVDRRVLVQRLLGEFDVLRTDPESILPAWREHAFTLGQRVRIETTSEIITGEAIDISFPGALELETSEGSRTVSVGDCEHLRPF